MKEFIKKLIERLEEYQNQLDTDIWARECDNWHGQLCNGKSEGVDEIISIVNQLAEECQQEPSTIIETVRGNRIDCEVPSDYFEQIKEVRIVDELTEETKVFKEVKDGWIPCSERLPEYDEEYYKKNGTPRTYIVMNEKAYAPSVAYYTKDKLWFYNDMIEFKNVVAWQPLPEPYQIKGE